MDKKFVTNLQGKEFILFEGLLDMFHKNGGKSIKTEIISNDPFIVQATVEGEKGTYQGIGDADEDNVNRLIAKHKIRMSETRAIARALRWYNNIGMCSVDELGGEVNKPTLEKDHIVELKKYLKSLGCKNKGDANDIVLPAAGVEIDSITQSLAKSTLDKLTK